MSNTAKTQPPGDVDDEGWLRKLALPEEYVIAPLPIARGGYGDFQSENVVDLVPHIRCWRAKQHAAQKYLPGLTSAARSPIAAEMAKVECIAAGERRDPQT